MADKFFAQLLIKKAWTFWRKAVCERDTILAKEMVRKRLHDKVSRDIFSGVFISILFYFIIFQVILEVSDYIPDQMREV